MARKGVKLGTLVVDSITGFKGIAIARTEYLNGCIRVAVQPEGLADDGKPLEDIWFDEQQLGPSKAKAGGPQKDPKDPWRR